MAPPRARYCKRGHDTHQTGRDSNYACKECRRESDRRRDPARRAREAAKVNRRYEPRHANAIEWERARVKRWSEIVKEKPLDISLKSTQLRMREFETRYQQLEADVPTPEKA